MINRREVLKVSLGGLAFLATSRSALAIQGVGVRRLNRSMALITGFGSNVLALETPDGQVLVDSGSPQFASQLTILLGNLSRAGVETVFNTHYHLDNTGANEALADGGAKIIAHEGTRLWMSADHDVPEGAPDARPVGALPTQTFQTTGSMTAGAEQIDYGYLGDAHTSGDIFVFFRDSNVLAVGDVASPALDPSLDYVTGAWIGPRVDAMDLLLELSNEDTDIVPAFGRVMTRAELRAERDMMEVLRERTILLAREGQSPRDMLDLGLMDGLPRIWDDPYKFLFDNYEGLRAHQSEIGANIL
jgi:glyoxylase-like metal-dependent hydrolase (beta-lactamase superfamily II)